VNEELRRKLQQGSQQTQGEVLDGRILRPGPTAPSSSTATPLGTPRTGY
jgi:hypothetical protein